MQRWLRDVRDGTRRFHHRRGMVALVVWTFGLGLGAAATLLAVRGTLLDRPLGCDPDGRWVMVWNYMPSAGYERLPLSDAEWFDHRRSLHAAGAVDAAAAFVVDRTTLTGMGQPRELSLVRAEPELLGMLKADRPPTGDEPACWLSHRVWHDVFDAADVEGRLLWLDGRAHRVAGVLPERAAFPPPITWQGRTVGDGRGADVFVPLRPSADAPRSERRLMAVARLSDGVTVGQAKSVLAKTAQWMSEEHPREHPPTLSSFAIGLHGQSVEILRPALRTLTLAVVLVLAVACVNVSLLLLARGVDRRGEMAVRATFGARRRHLLAAAWSESIGLSLLGGVMALGAAAAACALVRHLKLPGVPALGDVALDVGAIASLLGLALACGLVTGLAPGWRLLFGELSWDLKATARATGGVGIRRLQDTLVATELALAVAVLAVAVVLTQDFVRLWTSDPGFRYDDVVVASLRLPETGLPETGLPGAGREETVDRLLAQVAAVEGVELAAATASLPLGAGLEASAFQLDVNGRRYGSGAELALVHHVTPEFFRVLGVPLLAGDVGGLDAQTVALSEGLARRLATDVEELLGSSISFDDPEASEARWWTVGAVVADFRQQALAPGKPNGRVQPAVYLPLSASAPERLSLVVTSKRPAKQMAPGLTEAVRRIDAGLAVDVAPLGARVAEAMSQARLVAVLLVGFSLLAAFLGALGVHGVLSFQVSRRRRELALRMAVGATSDDLRREILRRAGRWALWGGAAGLLLAWLLGRTLRSLLPGFAFEAVHLLPIVSVVLALVPLAWLAAWWPARRAARVDPVVGLRTEG